MTESCCIACGGDVTGILDLGSMPLADALFTDRESSLAAERYPLSVGRCERCHWVQLLATPPREVLFPADYPYYSTVSDGVNLSAKAHAEELIASRGLGPGQHVMEIASNDGYQLQWFRQAGIQVLGIDPAPGPVAAARAIGITSRQTFFDSREAQCIRDEVGPADVILAKNVLAHVNDPGDFLDGVCKLLKPGGMASFEFPYLAHLLEHGQFDTIYHEHASYLAIEPLNRLLQSSGLGIVNIREIGLHGGSLRVDVQQAAPQQAVLKSYLRREEEQGTNSMAALMRLATGVKRQNTDLRAMVLQLRQQGLRIAAYGAAAKGVIQLNACGLDHSLIDFVVDRSPHKTGKFMAGTGIEIKPTRALIEENPDVVLLLSWNFEDEIRQQQSQWEKAGGRWLLPVPRPRLTGLAA